MSLQAYRLAWATVNITPTERLTLLCLAEHADAHCLAFTIAFIET
jgi:hypothetical protein